MKKSSIIILFSLLLLSFFLNGNNTAYAKSSFSSLIPTATMRDPQMEEKDLDSCFASAINTVVNLVSGGGSSGGGCSLDSLARIVAQQVAGTEFQSMMNMVGQGFFGDTAFLTNPQSYYHDVNKEITDNFISGITQENIPGMLPSLLSQVKTQIIKGQNTQYQSALSRGQDFPGGEAGLVAFENDWNACPTGNGWDCFEALQEPKNDPFVAQRIIGEDLAKAQREGLQQSSAEVAQGNGFLSLKTDCPQTTDANGIITENHWVGCNVSTPGSILKDQTNTYLASSLEQIGQADELDEAIIATAGGLFTAVTSWLGDKSLIRAVKPSVAASGISTNISCGVTKNTCKGYINGKAVTPSNTTTSASGYTWDCGSDISCEMPFSLGSIGTCGSFQNSCSTGRVEDVADTDSGNFKWNCLGSDNETTIDDAISCSAPRIVGSCGTTKDIFCEDGRAENIKLSADGGLWIWDCMGSDEIYNTNDANNRDDVFGCSLSTQATSCGTTYNTCINGNPSNSLFVNYGDTAHWTCTNTAGIPRPIVCPTQ